MQNHYILKRTFHLIFLSMLLSSGIWAQSGDLLKMQEFNSFFENTADCKCIEPGMFIPAYANTMDTVLCYAWPYMSSEWQLQSITVRTWNEQGLLAGAVVKNIDAQTSDTVPVRKSTYTYYEDGSLELDVYQIWNPDLNGGTWSNITKKLFEYNVEGDLYLTTSWFSYYDETDWRDGTKEFIDYNEYGLKDTVIVQYWNTIQNEWYYSYRYRYIYNSDLDLSEFYPDWANNENGEYVLNVRTVYERDPDLNTLDKINQYHNLDEWVNDDHEFMTLNEENLPDTVLYQNWDPWSNLWDTLVMNRDLFQYNESGKVTEHITQSYYFTWFNIDKEVTDYYESGEIQRTLLQDWDFNSSIWINSSKCEYPLFENVIAAIDLTGIEEPEVLVAPNPSSDQVTVKSNIPFYGIEIINMHGEVVYRNAGEMQGSMLNINFLPDGIYIVKINYSANSVLKKLIIKH